MWTFNKPRVGCCTVWGVKGVTRTIVGVRCHTPDAATLRTYEAAKRAVGEDNAFLCVTALNGTNSGWPTTANIVHVDASLLDKLHLRSDIPDAPWRCGDYCYYALRDALEFEYAWLLEPDVAFQDTDLAELVAQLVSDPSDFLAARLWIADDKWSHTSSLTARGIAPVWHSLFSMTRASTAAIDAAQRLRWEIQWKPAPAPHPNDESVFATAAVNSGLRVADLTSLLPGRFDHFRYSSAKKYLPVLSVAHKGPQIFHPVLQVGEYEAYLDDRLQKAADVGRFRLALEILDRATDLPGPHRSLLREKLGPLQRLLLASSPVINPTRRMIRTLRIFASRLGHMNVHPAVHATRSRCCSSTLETACEDGHSRHKWDKLA